MHQTHHVRYSSRRLGRTVDAGREITRSSLEETLSFTLSYYIETRCTFSSFYYFFPKSDYFLCATKAKQRPD